MILFKIILILIALFPETESKPICFKQELKGVSVRGNLCLTDSWDFPGWWTQIRLWDNLFMQPLCSHSMYLLRRSQISPGMFGCVLRRELDYLTTKYSILCWSPQVCPQYFPWHPPEFLHFLIGGSGITVLTVVPIA